MTEKDLSISEEMAIEQSIREPFADYLFSPLNIKCDISFSIRSRDENEILLLDIYGFSLDFIFAGLTEKHIAYIAKNAPKNYKENLLKILQDIEMMKGVFEIAIDMDTDIGKNVTQNQDRVKNVIQYIKDNRVAFEF